MPRMLDLIRNSQVPANLLHSAAQGSLSLPPGETLEILVYLALHHPVLGEQARLTLVGWDERAILAAAADPATSADVLAYFISLQNLSPALVHALAENPSVSEEALDALVVSGSSSTVGALLTNPRVLNSPRLLNALQSNPILRPNEQAEIRKMLARFEATPEAAHSEAEAPDEVVEVAVIKYLEENAAELAAEADKPFQPIGMEHDHPADEGTAAAEPHTSAIGASAAADGVANAATGVAPSVGASSGAPGKPAATASAAAVQAKKHPPAVHEQRRESTLQKISKLDIRGRIALAMRGSKEDRSILIRDSTKLVAAAVLESPKVSEGEVEKFALQKNVLQSVLRAIPLKRKFAKNYNITRNLVCNPRTPIDLSLGLMKNLLIHDLKNLSANKEVSDTIRKLALRMFKQKLEKKN
jgi:hypothetical protein